jgi:Putative transposase of IS4/5 family (DUF4096)
MSRTDLSEKQWCQLEPHLPGDPHCGHAYVDHRRGLNGILWRLKTGAVCRPGMVFGKPVTTVSCAGRVTALDNVC